MDDRLSDFLTALDRAETAEAAWETSRAYFESQGVDPKLLEHDDQQEPSGPLGFRPDWWLENSTLGEPAADQTSPGSPGRLAISDDRRNLLLLAALCASNRHHFLRTKEEVEGAGLSPRECEVLLWLSKGMRAARIAERMSVAEVTVNMHLSNARRKLRAATREQALARALYLGLIDP